MVTLVPIKHFSNFWCSVSHLSISDTADKELVAAIVKALKENA